MSKMFHLLWVLPGGSPCLGGVAVSEWLWGDLVVLLDSGVVTTVNVLCESLVVVPAVVAVVTDEPLVDKVTLEPPLPFSSTLSVPVGPQSINPATVVVRPS